MDNAVKVVVNSTAIIVLCKIGRIELLRKLFSSVVIPEAVYNEVLAKDDRASRYLVKRPSWISIKEAPALDIKSLMPAKLHAGEVEVMLLAMHEDADILVLDDYAARKTAQYLGFTVTGTLGILQYAKQKGLVGSVVPCIRELRAHGFRISDKVVDAVLRQSGEL